MATEYSIQKMVSDGTLSTLALGIQYIQRNDIYMRIAGTETPQSGAPSGYTWTFLDNTTLRILPVVPNGVEVVVYRRTDVDAMYNIYSQNAQFDEKTIDENNQQLLYIAQEYLEQGIPGAGVDTIEFLRDDGSYTYYRVKRTDGSYSDEFAVPSAGSITKVLARETLRRSCAEAGRNLKDGSFQVGFTLVNANDVALDESSGKVYSGVAGIYPAGTSTSGFVDESAILLATSFVSVFKYLTATEIADIVSGTASINVNAKCQAASEGNKELYFPPGTYLVHRLAPPAGHVIRLSDAAKLKRDYYPGATETALVVMSDYAKLIGGVIDGNKTSAPTTWGTGTYAVGVTGWEVSGVKYKNCKRDGLYVKDSSDFIIEKIDTDGNVRAGVAIVGNCSKFAVAQLRHKNDGVAGLDLEPDVDSSANTGFSISNVLVDGTLCSVQGASNSLVNRNGTITNLTAINGGVIRFNKFDDLAVSGISCDGTSELRVEDSYPNIFGRGVGGFSGVNVTLRQPDAVNQVPEPYFTSVPSLSWAALTSGAGASISHVLVPDWGKHVAQITVAAGSAGHYATYVSPSIPVSGNEWVSIGGSLKALTGRPSIEIQYRVGSTVLDTYRAAGGTSADGIWRKFMKYTKTPPTCDNVRFIIGGAFDTVGNFSGDFDGFYVYRNCFKHDAGPINSNLVAAKAYDPVSLADGVGITTTVTCPGAALGDMAAVSFSLDLQGVMISAWVSSVNTVSVRFQNETGATVDLASGVLKVRVIKG